MDLLFYNNSNEEYGDVVTLIGQCVNCRPQKVPGTNSLIVTNQTPIGHSALKVELQCLVCRTLYRTKLRK